MVDHIIRTRVCASVRVRLRDRSNEIAKMPVSSPPGAADARRFEDVRRGEVAPVRVNERERGDSGERMRHKASSSGTAVPFSRTSRTSANTRWRSSEPFDARLNLCARRARRGRPATALGGENLDHLRAVQRRPFWSWSRTTLVLFAVPLRLTFLTDKPAVSSWTPSVASGVRTTPTMASGSTDGCTS